MKYLDASNESYTNYNGATTLTPSASSNSVASRLYSNGRSRRTSLGSDPDLMQLGDTENMLLEFTSIANEMTNLSKRLADCQEEKDLLSEERSRLRTETALLHERVHRLEDQLSTAEISWEEKISDEKSRAKDTMARLEREKQLELENMNYRYQVLEKEMQSLQKDKSHADESTDEMQLQMSGLQNELDELKSLNSKLEKEKQKLRSEFESFRLNASADIDEREELLQSLTQQTEEMRRNENRPRHGSLSEQLVELQEEIEHLRIENKNLCNQTEELRAHLLNESVERGQTLLANGGPSLAAELQDADVGVDEVIKDDRLELRNALCEQELCNQKLRSYIDNILSRVIEIYPDILEISSETPTKST